MREILFKAKRKDNGEWIEGFFVKAKWYIDEKEIAVIIPINSLLFPHCEISEWFEVDESTLCQYTGLTDKNGNKIWENDVVKDNVVFGNIVWDSKYAQFMINDEFDGNQDYSDWWQEVEVIGNIFDNPELIKECD